MLGKRTLVAWVLDGSVALALTTLAAVEIWLPLPSVQGSGSQTASTVVAVVLCLTLTFRRVWPLATALVVLLALPLAFSIQPILVLFWGELVPIVIATYSVARHGTRRASLIGALAAIACLLYFDLGVAALQGPEEVLFHWLVVVLAWLVGFMVNRFERRAATAQRRAVEVETESRTLMLTAIADERSRIARELHDIVAHAVSVMVVQAGAAEQLVHDDPTFVRQALINIRKTGAGALGDMRRVVSMLRDSNDEPLRPQPGLAAVDTLVADARNGGLEVSIEILGTPRVLPPGLDLAAYRIIQEALTNARRHSGATRAGLTVAYTDSSVRVEVRDDGSGGHGSTDGHGLIGMRERAAVYGGRLETVQTDGRGFTVRADLPWAVQA